MDVDLMQKILQEHDDLKHYHLPCIVKSYSAGKVSVQPTLLHRDDTGKLTKFPVIYEVPVLLQKSLYEAPSIGDPGLLVFTDYSLDNWKSSGLSENIDPGDTRKADLTDAIFLPGLYQDGKRAVMPDDCLHISSELPIKITGNKIAIGNDSAELLQLIADLISVISATTGQISGSTVTLLSINPYTTTPVSLAAAASSVLSKLSLIKGAL